MRLAVSSSVCAALAYLRRKNIGSVQESDPDSVFCTQNCSRANSRRLKEAESASPCFARTRRGRRTRRSKSMKLAAQPPRRRAACRPPASARMLSQATVSRTTRYSLPRWYAPPSEERPDTTHPRACSSAGMCCKERRVNRESKRSSARNAPGGRAERYRRCRRTLRRAYPAKRLRCAAECFVAAKSPAAARDCRACACARDAHMHGCALQRIANPCACLCVGGCVLAITRNALTPA